MTAAVVLKLIADWIRDWLDSRRLRKELAKYTVILSKEELEAIRLEREQLLREREREETKCSD